jgi:hypothetical protein
MLPSVKYYDSVAREEAHWRDDEQYYNHNIEAVNNLIRETSDLITKKIAAGEDISQNNALRRVFCTQVRKLQEELTVRRKQHEETVHERSFSDDKKRHFRYELALLRYQHKPLLMKAITDFLVLPHETTPFAFKFTRDLSQPFGKRFIMMFNECLRVFNAQDNVMEYFVSQYEFPSATQEIGVVMIDVGPIS